MAIEFYDAAGEDGLYNVLGKYFNLVGVINTARATTIPNAIDAAAAVFANLAAPSLELRDAQEGFAGGARRLANSMGGEVSQIRQRGEQYVLQIVEDDEDQPVRSLDNALAVIIEQMEAAGDHFQDANAVSVSVTPDAGNVGDVLILATEKRGDGRVQELAYAETIAVEITAADGTTVPTVRFRGVARARDLLAEDWPKGSGADLSITGADPAATLLPNGDFEDESAEAADTPDGWIVSVGDPGTTIKLTDPEIQTITVAGDPTGGFYTLSWQAPSGNTYTTQALAYNATGAQVQTALREIPGLEAVTVSTSGTSPNLTHTIAFTGVAGNINQLTAADFLQGNGAVNETQDVSFTGGPPTSGNFTLTYDGQTTANLAHNSTAAQIDTALENLSNIGAGDVTCTGGPLPGTAVEVEFTGALAATNVNEMTATDVDLDTGVPTVTTTQEGSADETVTPATTQAGNDGAFRGRALEFDSDGAELTAIQIPLEVLEGETVYFCHGKIRRTGAAAAGTLKVEVIDGIGGSVLQDKQGNNAELSISASGVSDTGHDDFSFDFRLKRDAPRTVYLRIRISAAVDNTASIFFDEVVLLAAEELYAGGPFVQSVIGGTGARVGDKYDLDVTNDLAGQLQTYMHRFFDTGGRRILVPNAGGGTAIPDSVIS